MAQHHIHDFGPILKKTPGLVEDRDKRVLLTETKDFFEVDIHQTYVS